MSFAERKARVRAEIEAACAACGRDPATVELLAVSKTRDADVVRDAHATGQVAFGENRVQEFTTKAAELADLDLAWHFIGSLQTNKINAVLRAPGLALLHSVDREGLADALEARLAREDRKLAVLLQVVATGEPEKHGVTPEAAPGLLDHILAECPHVDVRGLMAMGPRAGDPAPVFQRVATLRDALRDRSGLDLPVLSLGMSGDLGPAIAAGSTLVRVGTALFGPR